MYWVSPKRVSQGEKKLTLKRRQTLDENPTAVAAPCATRTGVARSNSMLTVYCRRGGRIVADQPTPGEPLPDGIVWADLLEPTREDIL